MKKNTLINLLSLKPKGVKTLNCLGKQLIDKIEVSQTKQEIKLLIQLAYEWNVPQLDYILDTYVVIIHPVILKQ